MISTDSATRYAGGLALQAVYGYKPSQTNDYFLALAEECMNLLANQISPSGSVWLVDLFPFCTFDNLGDHALWR